MQPDWPGDPHGSDREANFYAALRPKIDLEFARCHFAGSDPQSHVRLVLLEDLAGYRYPDRTRRWTRDEANCFIRTYARLHACTIPHEDPHREWLYPITAARLGPEKVLSTYYELVSLGYWTPLHGMEALLDRVLDSAPEVERHPASLLHNDVFPPNIALPQDLSRQAILIDWEMAGYGPAELDLAYMFLQPFRSAQGLDREALLAEYWQQRYKKEGGIPPADVRRYRQHYADALWGLWLIPVAHRSVTKPFSPGSPPHQYWESMRVVLHEWLAGLIERPAPNG